MSSFRYDRPVVLLAWGLLFSFVAHFLLLSQFAYWSDVAPSRASLSITARISTIVDVSQSSSETRIPMPAIVPNAVLASHIHAEKRGDGEVSRISISRDESLDRSSLNNVSLHGADKISPTSQISAPVSEIAPPSSDAAPPLPAAVMIQFSSDGFLGVSEQLVHRFKQAEAHYVLSVEGGKSLSFSGFVQSVSLSEGAFVNGELMPARYLGPSGETVRFDWDAQQAVFSTSRVVALQGAAKDPLSIMYQLMRLVRSGVTSVVVLDGRDELRYDLMLLGEEGLDIGDTHYSTWRVRLSLHSDPESYRDFWLGKEVSGMPLKIRESLSDGKVRELLAKRIEVEMP